MKVLVTGEHDGLPKGLKVRGEAVEWIELPVLRFEAVEVPADAKARIFAEPPDWIVFPSPRAVEFWKQAIAGLPKGSRLAAIGRATGEKLGAGASFVPKQSGSEGFFDEFSKRETIRGKRFLVAGAESGRQWLGEKLTEAGASVERLALYRSEPLDLGPLPRGVSTLVFTSPSSVEAVLAMGTLPMGLQLVSIGKYTSESLKRRGLTAFREVPDGDLARLGEVL